jgi:hypothetical protein
MSRSLLSLLLALSVGPWMTTAVAAEAPTGPLLGLQTWTCRNMTFDEVVTFAVKHGIRNLQLIASHLDPMAPREETLRKKAILEKHGLVAYTFGVAGTSLDKEKNRRLFEFARLMGIKLIVVEPRDLAEWDNLEQLVKEYDIRLAIQQITAPARCTAIRRRCGRCSPRATRGSASAWMSRLDHRRRFRCR